MTPPRGAASPTSPQQLSAAEKLRKAVELRRGGATFQQIADAGYYASRQAAHRAVATHYGKLRRETTDELEEQRNLDLDRADAILRSLWPIAMQNQHPRHMQAVDRVERILRYRAYVLGLEPPKRHELTGGDGERLMPEQLDYANLDQDTLNTLYSALDQAMNGGAGGSG